ncbi:beta-lactamase domain protein [Desulfosudis oleivorans Hxd3]|uniref:Beta-lactamase domain protein n=2 Tax=Desulfosudis TaxID=2904716 RepID=A8ZSY2_DESOH|nr:beta-lactamase domain protein [Desulfosudis oleivorans Hxd3]
MIKTFLDNNTLEQQENKPLDPVHPLKRRMSRKENKMTQQRFGKLVFIPGTNSGKYPFCNSLYIDDEMRGIIDPASDAETLKALAAAGPMDLLINTHYHEDHFSFNFLFPGASLCVHDKDADCLASMDALLSAYGINDPDTIALWRDFLVEGFNYRERTPDRRLTDGEILDFGKTRLQVVHTPGHTPGHCSFYCEQEGVLFLGDLDLTPFGPWYGDAVSSIPDTIASVRRLMEIPARVWITSHNMGVLTQGVAEAAARYLAVIDEREQKIVDFLSTPRTLNEIAAQWFVYKKPREPEMFYAFGERGMAAKHLEYLMEKGDVTKEGGRYRRM